MSIKALTEMTRRYGQNTDYVIAAGGNTSYKDDGVLYVKASGQAMGNIEPGGFVALCRKKLSELFSRTYSGDEKEREAEVLRDALAARLQGQTLRPSVEALLHEVIPFAYVLHVHSPLINGITCAAWGRKVFDSHFADEGVWIEAIMPGYVLAVRVKGEIESFTALHGHAPSSVFIQNHGIFIGADTVEDIDARLSALEAGIAPLLTVKPELSDADIDTAKAAAVAVHVRMLLSRERPGIVTLHRSREALSLLASGESFESVTTTYTPDHIVYCGVKSLYISGETVEDIAGAIKSALDGYSRAYGCLPKLVGVRGLGVFCYGNTKKEAGYVDLLFADMLKVHAYAKSFGGAQGMPQPLVDEINVWEVEAYRKKVSLADDGGKRMSGKISIITGSAQGFGKGIAEEMAAAGAYVVIADLNGEGALAVAEELNNNYGPGTALGVKVNVADESDIRSLMERTALCYGGLDIYVSNAGILKAGGLEEMELATFELMTRINYTAYYLGAKYASRIMKLQHTLRPELRFDIIQINSKSGLSGSNKNFAYAGGKFGGIGLTQSFALELVEHGIKVNAICPGNFFDGPLWSDPERGLFVQYLRTGKVEGAKTVEDVKRFYEDKVPMKRGCGVVDVARAIFYVVEQQYETGQAVPVTGGQEMLK